MRINIFLMTFNQIQCLSFHSCSIKTASKLFLLSTWSSIESIMAGQRGKKKPFREPIISCCHASIPIRTQGSSGSTFSSSSTIQRSLHRHTLTPSIPPTFLFSHLTAPNISSSPSTLSSVYSPLSQFLCLLHSRALNFYSSSALSSMGTTDLFITETFTSNTSILKCSPLTLTSCLCHFSHSPTISFLLALRLWLTAEDSQLFSILTFLFSDQNTAFPSFDLKWVFLPPYSIIPTGPVLYQCQGFWCLYFLPPYNP